MRPVTDIIKIFRLPNLFIVAVLELILHQHIVTGILERENITPALSQLNLFILVVFSIVITWSGYLVNDIRDLAIDKINKNGFNQADFLGGRQTATKYYILLNIVSVALAIYLSVALNKWSYVWLLPVVIISLWLYSYKLKNHPFLGNIGVGILACLVMLLVWLAENSKIALIAGTPSFDYLKNIFLIYTAFAFLTTWSRELIKDAQDTEGDKSENIRTFPVVYGTKESMRYLMLLLLILLAGQCAVLYSNVGKFTNLQIMFAIFLLVTPVILVMAMAVKAAHKQDFASMSFVMKLIMLNGIIFLLTL